MLTSHHFYETIIEQYKTARYCHMRLSCESEWDQLSKHSDRTTYTTHLILSGYHPLPECIELLSPMTVCLPLFTNVKSLTVCFMHQVVFSLLNCQLNDLKVENDHK